MSRTEFEDIRGALRREGYRETVKPPSIDPDRDHQCRLCALDAKRPSHDDLLEYTDDLLYCPEIEREVFRHLLPVCLWAWNRALEGYPEDEYGAFAMQFSLVLIRGRWQEVLEPYEILAVRNVLGESILASIAGQDRLRFDGPNPSAGGWIDALGTYAIAFDDLHRIWNSWWRMAEAGQAVAVLQYASCLIYGDEENPVFAPATPEWGGGPPYLWNCTAVLMENGWRGENARFLQETLSPDYIRRGLNRARSVLEGHPQQDLPAQMAGDLDDRMELFSARLTCLSALAATGEIPPGAWPTTR